MSTTFGLVALVHAAATLAMAGVIWVVQRVVYPQFERASREAFAEFCREHQRRILPVVGPLMVVEGLTASWLVFAAPPGPAIALAAVGWLLLGAIWISTALVQAPLHRRLLRGYDRAAVERLVRSNRLRTAAWSARGLVALALLALSVADPV